MASKGPRSKVDHETRARRQKGLDAPRGPHRPKTHWDHVLEEMIWLSKDFESERKWKLAQAKKVALRASKGTVDQVTRGEKKVKEEEQRLRKIALNISKDVKKFWLKIEKLVLYKHQTELDVKKKKALDKQLEYLLGQTERYSTMLAENLVDGDKPSQLCITHEQGGASCVGEQTELNHESHADILEIDEDYDLLSEDASEDDEHTLEEDEALITEEERKEELAALHDEVDLPLEELLKRYGVCEASQDNVPENGEGTLAERDQVQAKDEFADVSKIDTSNPLTDTSRCSGKCNGSLSVPQNHLLEVESCLSGSMANISKAFDVHMQYDFGDEKEDGDFVVATGETKDDEATLSEEEELAKADSNDPIDEIALLQKESEVPIAELLARYQKDLDTDDVSEDESGYASSCSDFSGSPSNQELEEQEQVVSMDDDERGEILLHPPTKEQEGPDIKSGEDRDSEIRIADAAAAARSAQPTGNTFSTTKVRTKYPFLLKHSLREYQHIGLDWLVTMYEQKLNGILADEMGLGKTIMTIALLAHLACEKGLWGPHLIVVPTSVMLNWETEFLRWCPAFKILTYFGSAKERKVKRQGWMKPNSFHICITTYRLVIQDSKVFKRKKWKYLILDEAHLIKNWKSQRWQTLLNFNSKRRILLTGTPLQNDLMELWSLMHFLMPHVFQSHQEFKDWFSNPITGMVEGQEKVNKEVIDRLHNVLRPFILRRLKKDVEKQLPMKIEHVITCRLSRRQRNLYEDFIASSETQATLSSSNFFGMISVIMQLRKVCNHPDLFEGRPIVSSFDMAGIVRQLSSTVCAMLSPDPFGTIGLADLGLLFTHHDFSMTSWETDEVKAIATLSNLIIERASLEDHVEIESGSSSCKRLHGTNIFEEIQRAISEERRRQDKERASSIAWWNSLKCRKKPMYSTSLRDLVTVKHPVYDVHCQKFNPSSYTHSSKLAEIILSPVERLQKMIDLVESFMFAIPAARTSPPECWSSKPGTSVFIHPSYKEKCSEVLLPLLSPIRPAIIRRQVYFPDRRLIQFDCGKLQELAILLRRLKSEGHRALIFTQMTKMLDILEAFISLYGYTYMRLDGSTQPEERQTLMQRFNTNPKFFLFILSTRSGGVGINLVGADTVIFYDSDWNPAMDQQAQDRCHRIGQTREVHIYRLISESTIEENILKKAKQKRVLDDLVIQSGEYNTDFFKKLDPMELFSGHKTISTKTVQKDKNSTNGIDVSLSNADVEAALKHAEDEADYMALKKVEEEEAVENQEFTEEAIGRMDDDEFVNEDEMRADQSADQVTYSLMQNGSGPSEERSPALDCKEDDADMLVDVKQMAEAAAAAGQAISSFESQLRPIDRYAINFMELWDPVVDKTALDYQNSFEEKEWELDRIEKFKEDLEAEIDEDDEPLVYESWDADFATEAYRQQVEILAQHQLMEDLEREAKEKEDAAREILNPVEKDVLVNSKPKSKKKSKKPKFRSLKKGSLASESKVVKEEPLPEAMSTDDEDISFGMSTASGASIRFTMKKKRKIAVVDLESEEEVLFRKKKIKKVKKAPPVSPPSCNLLDNKLHGESKESKSCDNKAIEIEHKPASRSKIGGKISITPMTVKRVLVIKPEKLNKKGNAWYRDCFPSPDAWLPQEDSILCAMLHEYGPNWSLVSDTLYGMTAGGFYRGRFRHPVHCCERYRELIQRYILSTADGLNTEKVGNAGSGKALLKVTEENVQMLLDIATEMPDRELLIQKHFTALLSSVWRVSLVHQISVSSRNDLAAGGRLFGVNLMQISKNANRKPTKKINMTNLGQSSKLLTIALTDTNTAPQEDPIALSDRRVDASSITEQMEITLQIQGQGADLMNPLPSVINLSIYGTSPPDSANKPSKKNGHLKSSKYMAENRLREASRACDEDIRSWALSAFPTSEFKSRSASNSLSLGKHKLSFSDSVKSGKSKCKRKIEHNKTHKGADSMVQTVLPNDPNLRFELTPAAESIESDIGINNFNHNSHFCPVNELPLNSDDFELVPHQYYPGFINGLEDCSSLPEFTDIG